jgi:hypothetical protein
VVQATPAGLLAQPQGGEGPFRPAEDADEAERIRRRLVRDERAALRIERLRRPP